MTNIPHKNIPSPVNVCEQLSGEVYALKFSAWKRPIVRQFLQHCHVNFITDVGDVPQGGVLLVWGSRATEEKLSDDVNIIRLEDGFIRSVGLGADLIAPVSWVGDRRGIYYDAMRESDLENYCSHHVFDDVLRERSCSLREKIVAACITKYNVGVGAWTRPDSASRVILVPGQVEDDASIQYGASGIFKNLDLLKAVRDTNPDAYIIYKPHPDVLAGLRRKGENENLASEYCDEEVTDLPMNVLLDGVDEVHLMTSLTGFEALMRGVKVTCYGQPFYAGWGLTHDIIPFERRQRQLTVDELVAATLILYPTYISQVTGRYTTPERALDELVEWRDRKGVSRAGILLKAKRFFLGVGDRLRRG